MSKYRIELPIAFEENLETELWQFHHDLPSIAHNVLQEHGDSGGWPEVEFTGSRSDLAILIARYTNHHPADTAFMIEEMMEEVT